MGEIIDGRAVAAKVEAELRERVESLGLKPGLAVILVGDDPASAIYVRLKRRACERVGIQSRVHNLPASATEEEVLALVDQLAKDPETHGILVQLPMPDHIVEQRVIDALPPHKDVDGFHPKNAGHLVTDYRSGLQPCTPKGVMRLLAEYEIDTRGAHAAVVGRSRVVGRPMAAMLLAADATVTICHRHTRDSAALTSLADIVVVAVGRPGLVDASWIKPGAVVVDVGVNRTAEGKLVGDVVFDDVIGKARLLSPVPGGVGPMTIAMLLDNTVTAAERLTARAPAAL